MPKAGTKGRARWARSSNGRRVLILGLVREFHQRGLTRGFLHLVGLSELGSLKGNGAGKLDGSRAAAVLVGEGVQASVTTANLLLCARRSPIGGRAASTAKMLTSVVEKQLVTQRCTLCQNTSSICVITLLGVKRSAL